MNHSDIHRRGFVKRLAGGAAALGAPLTSAAEEKKPAIPADLASVAPAELWLELIKRIDPERLTSEHLDQLRGDLAVNLQRSARLSGFPLTNADEPAPVFEAWRAEG